MVSKQAGAAIPPPLKKKTPFGVALYGKVISQKNCAAKVQSRGSLKAEIESAILEHAVGGEKGARLAEGPGMTHRD